VVVVAAGDGVPGVGAALLAVEPEFAVKTALLGSACVPMRRGM
jgi:hypothetical protein